MTGDVMDGQWLLCVYMLWRGKISTLQMTKKRAVRECVMHVAGSVQVWMRLAHGVYIPVGEIQLTRW